MGLQWNSENIANVARFGRNLENQKSKNSLPMRFVTTTKMATAEMLVAKKHPEIQENTIFARIPSPFTPQSGDKGGGNRHIVGLLREIAGKPAINTQRALGREGVDFMEFIQMYVTKERMPWTLETDEISTIIQGAWANDMNNRLAQRLMGWAVRREAWYGIVTALIKGYNSSVIASAADHGYAVDVRHNPNLVCLGLPYGTGYGKMRATWSATPGTLESAMAKNIAQVTNIDADHYLTAAMVRKANRMAEEMNIEPIRIRGKELRLMVLHPDAMDQLKEDPNFMDHMQNWGTKQADQSMGWTENEYYVYGGFLITDDWDLGLEIYPFDDASDSGSTLNHACSTANDVTATPANADKIQYGPLELDGDYKIQTREMTNSRIKRSTTGAEYTANFDRRLNWVLGQKALMGLRHRSPLILPETYDFSETELRALSSVWGWSRVDQYDDFDTPTTVVNESSMPFVTASPFGSGYNE